MRRAAQSAKEIAEVFGFGFDFSQAFNLTLFIEHGNHGHGFVDIHAHILDIIHWTLLSELNCNDWSHYSLSQRGVFPYYVRRVTAPFPPFSILFKRDGKMTTKPPHPNGSPVYRNLSGFPHTAHIPRP